MLTIKIYTRGSVVLDQRKSIVVVRAESALWEQTWDDFYEEREIPDDRGEPFTFLMYRDEDGTPVAVAALFPGDQCYITDESGQTVEAVREESRAAH